MDSSQLGQLGFWINIIGLLLIGVGILFILKPDIFKRGIWTMTSIAQRTMTPENYLKYMKKVGVFYIILGILLILVGPERIAAFIASLG